MTRTAVILFNLGGPDSKSAIKPFLFNFFTDVNIIRLPYPFRWLLAKLIAYRRSKNEAGVSYGELGDKSPLLDNSKAQAQALQDLLGDDYKVFVCMRYWHPMADEVVRAVKDWNPDHITLLPLYPQYSTTTTRSSFQEWNKAAVTGGLDKPFNLVCCYPEQTGFIAASASNIREQYGKAKAETGLEPRILFSAHGLPEKIIKCGDPYQMQCELSAAAILRETGIEHADWQICYQSRVGPQKWLKPSTEDALEKAAHDKVPVVILPHAFTQEHVETLVEIDIEYRALAKELGVPGFYKVETVGTHPDFIQGLADMVLTSSRNPVVASNVGVTCCGNHKDCAMKQFAKLNEVASC